MFTHLKIDEFIFRINTHTHTHTHIYIYIYIYIYISRLLEWAARSIGLQMKTHKIVYMCFNERADISALNGGFLKLKKSNYIGSSVSSTENDVNI